MIPATKTGMGLGGMVAVLVTGLVLGYLMQHPEYSKSFNFTLVNKIGRKLFGGSGITHGTPLPDGTGRLFTEEELWYYNGEDESKPILLAIVGDVYDVTKGKKFYGAGKGYNCFAGRDGSVAFVSGDFTETGLIPVTLGLDHHMIMGIYGWAEFYNETEKYPYVGKLIGYHYDGEGNPTEAKEHFLWDVSQGEDLEQQRKEHLKERPNCNIKWDNSVNEGEIWCTTKSGGIERDWVGRPRKIVDPFSKGSTRCACIPDDVEDDATMEVYPECDPRASRCKTFKT